MQTSDELNQKHPRASQLAAGGFRDITRIASSDPKMWTDILLTNQEIMLSLLAEWQSSMETLKTQLARNDEEAIYRFLHKRSRQGISCRRNDKERFQHSMIYTLIFRIFPVQLLR